MKSKESFLETIKFVNAECVNLKYHQARYEEVMKFFRYTDIKDLKTFLNPPVDGIYKCRLIYSNSSVNVSYSKYIKKNISSLKLIVDNKISYSKKSTNRDAIENLFRKKENADDIIIVKNGLITDTSTANIAFLYKDRWISPKTPLLKGTTRERLLNEKKIFEEDIKVDDLSKFSKVALLNAMIDFYKLEKCEFLV